MDQEVLAVLAQRDAERLSIPRVRKLADARLTILSPEAPTLDKGKMTATGIISTEKSDRSEDIVLTKGIFTANHRHNPVVLLEHALKCNFPIAQAEDPNGAYTVKAFEDYAAGTSYFSQRDPLSEQVYRLVDDKLLRGLSVGFRPIKARLRPYEHNQQGVINKGNGLLLEEVELLEYSHCLIPDNPECITLAQGVIGKSLCGRAMHPELEAYLKQYVPELKQQVIGGWQAPSLEAFRKSIQPEQVTKKNDNIEDRYTPLPEDNSDARLDGMDDMKPGAKALTRIHDELQDICDVIDEVQGSHEQEEIAGDLGDLKGVVEEWIDRIQQRFTDKYPGLDPLKDEQKSEEEQGKTDGVGGDGVTADSGTGAQYQAPGTKSRRPDLKKRIAFWRFVKAASRRARLPREMVKSVCMKAASHLGEMGEHQGEMTEMHRGACKYHEGELTKMCKSLDKPTEEDYPASGTQANEQREGLKSALAQREAELSERDTALAAVQAELEAERANALQIASERDAFAARVPELEKSYKRLQRDMDRARRGDREFDRV